MSIEAILGIVIQLIIAVIAGIFMYITSKRVNKATDKLTKEKMEYDYKLAIQLKNHEYIMNSRIELYKAIAEIFFDGMFYTKIEINDEEKLIDIELKIYQAEIYDDIGYCRCAHKMTSNIFFKMMDMERINDKDINKNISEHNDLLEKQFLEFQSLIVKSCNFHESDKIIAEIKKNSQNNIDMQREKIKLNSTLRHQKK